MAAWYRADIPIVKGYDLLAAMSAGDGLSIRTAFNLTDANLDSDATRIPDYMFYKNLNVEEINLTKITEVGSNSFYQCPYIKKIYLPNCTLLKSSAFIGSSRSQTGLSNFTIYLPKVVTIQDSALREMSGAGITCTLTLSKCETLQSNAIRGASGRYFVINKLNLPKIVSIGQECLSYHQITTVDIGDTCTSIASKPFNGGTIGTLICRATTPPSLHANGLGCTPTHIYVPTDSVATYQGASNWSAYASIIEAIPT